MSSRLAHEISPPVPSVEPGQPQNVTARPAWLGTRTWPAYWAAGVTAASGLLKAGGCRYAWSGAYCGRWPR